MKTGHKRVLESQKLELREGPKDMVGDYDHKKDPKYEENEEERRCH